MVFQVSVSATAGTGGGPANAQDSSAIHFCRLRVAVHIWDDQPPFCNYSCHGKAEFKVENVVFRGFDPWRYACGRDILA
jgi:hypothetical protein